MKNQWLSRGRFGFGVCLASVAFVLAGASQVSAQQGVYITQASARLTKLVDNANSAGYALHDNSFSIGGGWLKQSQSNWVPLFTLQMTANKEYRVLASGDNDAKDVDLEIVDSSGKVVASDTATDPNAVVNFRPTTSGKYLVRVRLYDSANNLPCVCLAIVMSKK